MEGHDRFLLASQLAPTFDKLQRLATQLDENSPAFNALIKKTSNQYRLVQFSQIYKLVF